MVWSYVEVGVGVVAACLPTLQPWLHRQAPESIVNSVRSKISLQSFEFGQRKRAPDSTVGTSKSDLESQDYDILTPERSNHEINYSIIADRIERINDDTHPNILGKIHVQHGVTVRVETAS
jgi:hypothetical protein